MSAEPETDAELLARAERLQTELARAEAEIRRRNDLANKDLRDFLFALERHNHDAV